MGLIKLPFVLERFDVVAYEDALGIKLLELDNAVVLVAFQDVNSRGDKGEVEASRTVRIGDALLCIDETPIELLQYNVVLGMLKTAERPVTLTFGRTEEKFAKKVREKQLATSMKLQQESEKARLRQLEAERKARKSKHLEISTSNGPGANREKLAGGKLLYTSKDFKGTALRPSHKLVIGLGILMLICSFGYFVDFDILGLSTMSSEGGETETFHIHNKAKIDQQFESIIPESRDHSTKNNTHVRPSLQKPATSPLDNIPSAFEVNQGKKGLRRKRRKAKSLVLL